MNRDTIADSLRGLGIILVMFTHVLWIFYNNGTFPKNANTVADYIASFHMPLFFMISGYVHAMKQHDNNCWTYIRKSLVELYLPCLYFSFLYWLPKFILASRSSFAGANNIATSNITELLNIPLMGFNLYWFLCTMFFVRVLHILFECYVKNEYVHSLFWIVVFIAVYLYAKDIPQVFQFRYGLYFHLGFMMRRHALIPKKLLWGIVLFLAGTACFMTTYETCDNILTAVIPAVCLSIALFTIFYALKISNGFLVTCGVNSMVIYCVHEHIIVLSKVAYSMTGLSSTASKIVLFVLCAFISILIPLMIVWLYRNVRCLRWIEYIFYPGKYKR